MTGRIWQRLAIALAIAATGSALTAPADAQGFDDRYWSDQRMRRPAQPPRDYFPFSFFGGDRAAPTPPLGIPFIRPPQPVESFKAPPPRKPETPPTTTVLVIGDSLADWLGYGLEEALADTPEIGVARKIRANSGLVRYEAHSDTPEWSQVVKEMLATEKPDAIVVMLGLNDRQPLRERLPARPAQPAQPGQAVAPSAGPTAGQAPPSPAPGSDQAPPAPAGSETAQPSPAAAAGAAAGAASDAQHQVQGASYDFHTDKWGELYGKRIDEMIAALKSKGVPVLWVGLPAIRGARTTSDMSYLDELYRARAEKAGVVYVDIWDGFVDDSGRYAVEGPDFEGQMRRLRSSDGVHFSKAGAVKLAKYVERELRRVISNRISPVALPGPEEQPKPGAAGARPAVGPVVPLSATGGAEGGDLLGAGRPAQAAADPIAARVLSRGDSIVAPAGRADDFSWPRPAASANASPDVEPAPAAPPPAAPPAKGAAGKSDANKSEAKKPADAKTQAAPETAPAKPRRSRAELDGAPPRPPMPVGRGF